VRRVLGVFAVATLVHEVWEAVDETGMVLHTCCLAGPLGDGCRVTLAPAARLIAAFEAGCHSEAMTIYNLLLGREAYCTDQASDHQPYPEEGRTERPAYLAGDV